MSLAKWLKALLAVLEFDFTIVLLNYLNTFKYQLFSCGMLQMKIILYAER